MNYTTQGSSGEARKSNYELDVNINDLPVCTT